MLEERYKARPTLHISPGNFSKIHLKVLHSFSSMKMKALHFTFFHIVWKYVKPHGVPEKVS
jgi:hypothetical protein